MKKLLLTLLLGLFATSALAESAPTPQRWNIYNDTTIVSKKNNVRIPRKLFLGSMALDSAMIAQAMIAYDSSQHDYYRSNEVVDSAAGAARAEVADSAKAVDTSYAPLRALVNRHIRDTASVMIEDSLDNYFLSTGDLDPDQLTGDATNNDLVDSAIVQGVSLAKVGSGGATLGQIPKWDGAKYAPATEAGNVNPSIYGDVFLYGDLRYAGRAHAFDTTNIYVPHASTFLHIHLPSAYINNAADSHTTIHGSAMYVPGGLHGWNRWLAFTKGSDVREDPMLRVSNNGTDWYRFGVGADSCPDPIWDSNGCIINIGGTGPDTAAHLSDVDLMVGADGKLWIVWRANYQNDTEVLWVSSSIDGLTWSTPDSIMSATNGIGTWIGLFLSPAWWVDTAGTYKMIVAQAINLSPCANKLKLYESATPDGTWSFVDTVKNAAGATWQDTLEMKVGTAQVQAWHIDVIPNGADEKIILMGTRAKNNDVQFYAHIGKSKDGGRSITMKQQPILVPLGANVAWDGDAIYRPTGFWVDDGNSTYMELYYGARSTIDSGIYFRTGRTTLYNDARFGTFDIPVVHGRTTPPTDSVVLTLPQYGPWLFVDSSYDNSKDAVDSAIVTGTVPYDMHTLDSLIYTYKSSVDSCIIDSIVLWGPDRSNGTNMCDSIYYEDATDRASTSSTRVAYYLNELTVRGGDRFALKFRITLFENSTEPTMRVGNVQLKGRVKL